MIILLWIFGSQISHPNVTKMYTINNIVILDLHFVCTVVELYNLLDSIIKYISGIMRHNKLCKTIIVHTISQ